MPTIDLQLSEEFQNHKYKIRAFIPGKVRHDFQVMMINANLNKNAKEDEEVTLDPDQSYKAQLYLIKEMVVESYGPKFDEAFFNGYDCNADEMDELFTLIAEKFNIVPTISPEDRKMMEAMDKKTKQAFYAQLQERRQEDLKKKQVWR